MVGCNFRFLLCLLVGKGVTGFQSLTPRPLPVKVLNQPQSQCTATTFQSTRLFASGDDATSTADIEGFLKEQYPAFMMLLQSNEKACKVLRESTASGFTVFAPTEKVFVDLGESMVSKLGDPRNFETAEKIGAYHVINEAVSADALFNAGGVVTMGGEVPIDRSVSGGFFGVGGKEDGGVTLNGAKVLKSVEVGNGIVHEMDNLISPKLLWRYLDQLRIPGSK